jgi:MoaA/NifB/PqqE/SkfB family radical SAM enzyme
VTSPVTTVVAAPRPASVVWDITYACPLRCAHCYSESGRRPARQLSWPDLSRVADALVELGPRTVVLSGGEPLVVAEIFEVARRLRAGGVSVHLYTGGWHVTDRAVDAIMDLVSNVTVSIDGATAATHDLLRGRAGSFDRAMDALERLSAAAWQRTVQGRASSALGVDYTVTRTNFGEMRDFCRLVSERVPYLHYLFFGAAMPIGLASRAGFVRYQIVSPDQLRLLRDDSFADTIRAHASAALDVCVSDNAMFQMHPERLGRGEIPAMQVEPDGRVRAMPIYEGTVGSLLAEAGTTLWEHAVARWNDPRVQQLISPALTMEAWAEATRRLDLMFGSAGDRARIERRPEYSPAPSPNRTSPVGHRP